MTIRGFIDESYSGDQKNGLFTLTCLFVRPEILAWFDLAWQRTIEKTNESLEKHGRQPIKRFHAVDLNGGKGEFETWSKEERIALAKDLIKVIRHHNSSHTAFTMDLADLEAVWPEHPGDLMAFAYNIIMKLMMKHIGDIFEQEGMREQIDFVIERGPGSEPMLAAHKQLTADLNFRYKSRFDSIRVGSWESDVLLQAADLFAYEAYKDAVRRKKSRTEARLSMKALLDLESVGIATHYFSREAIVEIKEMHEKSLAAQDSSDPK